jgi:hypothetical protein
MLNRQIPSVGNAVQSSEMMRNSLGLNYKSAALPAELCRRFISVDHLVGAIPMIEQVFSTISTVLLKQISPTNIVDQSAALTGFRVAVAVRSMAP